jgi:HSP20 family protein
MIIKCETKSDLQKDSDEQNKDDELLCFYPKDDIKNFFDNFFSSQKPLFSFSQKIWNPPTDVYETKDNVFIKMEIAGVSKEDIDITVEDNILRVRGLREDKPKVSMENYHIMEIHYGEFERTFRLPNNLKIENITANYKDGFLLISIPKIHYKPQEITVKIKE